MRAILLVFLSLWVWAPCLSFCGTDTHVARIVSLAPSITEIIYTLGLGDRLVGVTSFSNYPAEAKKLPKIGTYIHLNLEKIIQLNPDIAIGTWDGNRRLDIRILKEMGIKVYMTTPKNIWEVINSIQQIGMILGIPQKGVMVARSLRMRIDNIRKKVSTLKRVRVFLQINNRPLITVNKDTFQNDLMRLAGGINIAEDEPIRYPRISIEEVIYRRPEVIIISSMEIGGKFEEMRQEWMKWKDIPAVKNGRVFLVNSDLLDRASPRLVEGLETLARLIHPEAGWR